MSNVISRKQHLEIMSRRTEKAMAPARVVMRTGGLTLTGALLGFLESKGTLPTGFFKNRSGQPMIPTKAALAVVAHAAAAFSRGNVRASLEVLGDAAAANYGYAAGKAHVLVAGE